MTHRTGKGGRPWLTSVIGRYLLPLWFGIFAIFHAHWIAQGIIGLDGRIYHRAAAAWLAGADPWAQGAAVPSGIVYHFAGLPPTVLLYAPFAWIPERIFAPLLVVASFVAAAWIIRRLALPWWWILFPPIVLGAMSANPGIILLALLLSGRPWTETLAAGLKVYAVVPMVLLGRWRGVGLATVVCAATVVIWPDLWLTWWHQADTVSARLLDEALGGSGATAHPVLIPATMVAIVVIAALDWRQVAWLSVPALWPSGQFHYAVMAMPVMTVLLAFLLAMPIYGLPALAVIIHAWLLAWRRLRPDLGDEAIPRADPIDRHDVRLVRDP